MTGQTSGRGFTLFELLVVLAVLMILLAIGVPSFVEMVRDSRLSTATRSLAGTLHLARSEAVKRAELVTVCARARSVGEDPRCGDATDWSHGWIVFVDPSAGHGDGIARVDADDEVLALAGPIPDSLRLEVYGVRGSGTAPKDAASYLRFQPPGQTEWSGGNVAGSLLLCAATRGRESSRVLNVQPSGDVRRGRPSGDERVARDARNLPVDCGDDP